MIRSKSSINPPVSFTTVRYLRASCWLFLLPPAEGADGVFRLVSGVVLVLSSRHIQKTIHHSHALVEALCWQLGEVTPGGSSVTRVPPQHLNAKVKGQFGILLVLTEYKEYKTSKQCDS